MLLRGQYEVTVDAKGRFMLPGAFKKQFPEGAALKFVVCSGFEDCISMFTEEEWEKEFEKLNKIDDRIPEHRIYKRVMLSGTADAIPDSNDRVLLPKQLLEDSGITKDMILLALGTKVELWDKDRYQKHIKRHREADTFSKLAEVVGKSDTKQA